nr:MAG TPA: hypothetical protein [Crassvirales sp.]DAX07784.1 MAG TPA: hypothetical protein [Caudoviricetes sp.]
MSVHLRSILSYLVLYFRDNLFLSFYYQNS